MIVLDVNVLVYALRREFPQHPLALDWLTRNLTGPEAIVAGDEVLAAAVRLLTHRNVLATPLAPEAAIEAVEAIRSAPAVVVPQIPASRWTHFRGFVDGLGLRANDIPDALLAATTASLGARLATFDRGFRRFPGLEVIEPTIDSQTRTSRQEVPPQSPP